MNNLHDQLTEKHGWYARWHAHPARRFVHWTLIVLVAGLATSAIVTSVKLSVDYNSSSASDNPGEVSIASPTDGATVSGRTVSVYVYAWDTDGLVKLELYIDNQLRSTITIPTRKNLIFSWSTRKDAAGQHQLNVKLYDRLGNTTLSAPVTVTLVK